MRTLFVRTEANKDVALGHLSRCLSIVQAAVALGARGEVMADDTDEVRALVEGRGAVFRAARTAIGSPEDAAVVAKAAAGSRAVLLDSYRLDAAYMESARRSGIPVALLDDNADREVDCDVLINFGAAAPAMKYRGRVGRALLGTAYVPLGPDYWNAAPGARELVSTVLVTLGGIDHYGMSERLLAALEPWEHRLKVTMIVGPFYENAASIRAAAARSRHEVVLVERPAGLASHIEAADLVLCGGGQTLYECGAFGKPSLGIAVWPIQRPTVDALTAAGATWPLVYDQTPAFDGRLAAAVRELLADAPLRARLGAKAHALVDGRGARRVAESLLGPAKEV